jgi:hypothetical protein
MCDKFVYLTDASLVIKSYFCICSKPIILVYALFTWPKILLLLSMYVPQNKKNKKISTFKMKPNLAIVLFFDE